jgi:hypothetical protein
MNLIIVNWKGRRKSKGRSDSSDTCNQLCTDVVRAAFSISITRDDGALSAEGRSSDPFQWYSSARERLMMHGRHCHPLARRLIDYSPCLEMTACDLLKRAINLTLTIPLCCSRHHPQQTTIHNEPAIYLHTGGLCSKQ